MDAATTIRDVETVSTTDAAKRLGVTPRTLYRLIDQNQLSAYRTGRKLYRPNGSIPRYS